MGIASRVEEALRSDVSREYVAGAYLAEVQQKLARWEDRYQQTAVRALYACAFFVLIIEASVEGFSLAGLQLRDLSLFQKALPAVIAFLFYQMAVFRAGATLVGTACNTIIRATHADLHRHRLELYLDTETPLTLHSILDDAVQRPSLRRLLGLPKLAVYGLGLLLPLVFEVYAYVQCFRVWGGDNGIVWLSLLSSVFFLFQGVIVLRAAHELV